MNKFQVDEIVVLSIDLKDINNDEIVAKKNSYAVVLAISNCNYDCKRTCPHQELILYSIESEQRIKYSRCGWVANKILGDD